MSLSRVTIVLATVSILHRNCDIIVNINGVAQVACSQCCFKTTNVRRRKIRRDLEQSRNPTSSNTDAQSRVIRYKLGGNIREILIRVVLFLLTQEANVLQNQSHNKLAI